MNPPANKKQKFQQHNKNKYFQSNRKKRYLEVGQRGFLATCNFNEKNCIRDCYNILNHYANELYGPEEDDTKNENEGATKQVNDDDVGDDDIVDDLQKQIDATKKQRQSNKLIKTRFQAVDTGVANCIFITTTLDDPIHLGMHIIKDMATHKEQRSRHLLRLIPIECVCKANAKDIIDAAGQLADKYFLKQSTTYAVVYKKRYNNSISKDGLVRDLAELIHTKNVMNKVDLENAKKSLILEVIKGLCCMSVIEDYRHYKKYNISELCLGGKDNNDDDKNDEISTKAPVKEIVKGNDIP